MDLNLGGKLAIVTGSGNGIGREIALTFAREGADVIVDDIDLIAANAVADEVRALGSRALPVRADVTDPTEVNRMVEQALSRFKRVDILVNNAGIVYDVEGRPMKRRPFIESTEKEWRREIDLSLYGTLNCTRAVMGPMIEQKGGAIINIVSDAGRGPWKDIAYGGGKGAIIAVSRSLAREVGRHGIRVNCVSPGIIRTTRGIEYEVEAERGDLEAIDLLRQREEFLKGVPLCRIGAPRDVANVAVFLASDASSYVTGQVLSVNGGSLMP